jgi:hypothetical protein
MNMTSKQKKAAKNAVNTALYAINYSDGLPVTKIDGILSSNGFEETEPAIYCGREGRSHQPVGFGVYLALSWYKMEPTGRYEIVAYVS